MTDTKKQIHKHNGFTLTLERDGDMVYADIEKNDFHGSLSLASDLGEIEHSRNMEKTWKEPNATLDFCQEKEENFD